MVFQWMSEPGLTTLLMNQVDERERGGAAAMNYLVAFSAQAAASIVGGQLLANFGYGRVIAGAAGAAVAAALLFRRLPGVSSPELSPAHPEPAAGNVPE
jgi:predicted MFS family arabinose efflux permease